MKVIITYYCEKKIEIKDEFADASFENLFYGDEKLWEKFTATLKKQIQLLDKNVIELCSVSDEGMQFLADL